ncbi:hypothetical protein Glove_242g4 [Diversispora epigaea]|uniref:Uncharacterized protein n=1 Tax=Diversispora epigaea TaxID=1348612 RepID=A0A397I9S3_9GLOM|nr:hypothetical protein Glove_242g4 [Diversispora epigaea]
MNRKKSKSLSENSNNKIVTAKQRLEHFEKALKPINYDSDNENDNTKHGFHKSTESNNEVTTIRIGDVSLRMTKPKNQELVPNYFDPFYEDSQEILRHLRWFVFIVCHI